jgi:hypothetical protein
VWWRRSRANEPAGGSRSRSPAALIGAGKQTSFPPILQAITFASDVDGPGMVQQPIQNRGCNDGIAKDRSPISVAFVGSQDDASAFVTSPDQLNEDGCSHVVQRQVAHLVDKC